MRLPVHPNRPELASGQLELQDQCVSNKSKTAHPQVMVMWVTWFAIFVGLFIIHQFAAPIPEGAGVEVEQVYSYFSLIAIGQCLISLVIRFLVVPRMGSAENLRTAMIFGVLLAEGAGIIGMFAVPIEQTNERSLMLSMSIACVLISAPIYAVKKLKEFTSQEAA